MIVREVKMRNFLSSIRKKNHTKYKKKNNSAKEELRTRQNVSQGKTGTKSKNPPPDIPI